MCPIGVIPTERKTPFKLARPCKDCPFRSDKIFHLAPGRAEEIAESLHRGETFYCHKTTVPEVDEDGEEYGGLTNGPNSQLCPGAMLTMEREGYSSQFVRIAERLGMLNVDLLDKDAPVFDSLAEWVAQYREDEGLTHCEVVGSECSDPPGFGGSGGAYRNTEAPQCDPDNTCTLCGHVMCPACTSDLDGDLACVYCAEEDEEGDGDDG